MKNSYGFIILLLPQQTISCLLKPDLIDTFWCLGCLSFAEDFQVFCWSSRWRQAEKKVSCYCCKTIMLMVELCAYPAIVAAWVNIKAKRFGTLFSSLIKTNQTLAYTHWMREQLMHTRSDWIKFSVHWIDLSRPLSIQVVDCFSFASLLIAGQSERI